jgi:hypothetical protein
MDVGIPGNALKPGFGKVVALHVARAHCPQRVNFAGPFYTFDDDLDAEVAAERNHGGGERQAALIPITIYDQGAIKFDDIRL